MRNGHLATDLWSLGKLDPLRLKLGSKKLPTTPPQINQVAKD